MPLTEPADRQLLHLRDITLRGYQRDDGLFDIEAHLVDTKDYGFPNEGRGWIEKGEALHGMWIRLTLDDTMLIHACEASSDFTPYDICPQAAPNFARLAGLRIGPGFNKAVKERVGGVLGCTHLREVLGQVATVAFQTLYPVRRKRERETAAKHADALRAQGLTPEQAPAKPNPLIGSCLAYAPDSPVTLARFQEAEPSPPDGFGLKGEKV